MLKMFTVKLTERLMDASAPTNPKPSPADQNFGTTGIAPMDVYELCVAPDARGRGLTGRCMIVVNPPWRLREGLAEVLPWVAEVLAQGRVRPPRIGALAG